MLVCFHDLRRRALAGFGQIQRIGDDMNTECIR